MRGSGAFDQWVEFQAETQGRDSIGGVTRSWATVISTWAATRMLGGQQSDKAGRSTHENDREFVIRRQDVTVTTKHRIVWNGQNWRINTLDDGLRTGEIKITAAADE